MNSNQNMMLTKVLVKDLYFNLYFAKKKFKNSFRFYDQKYKWQFLILLCKLDQVRIFTVTFVPHQVTKMSLGILFHYEII